MKNQNGKISYMKKFRIIVILLTALMTVGIVSCDDNDSGVDAKATPEDLTNQGWELFDRAEYDSSLGKFQDAINIDDRLSDAHNGAGWSSGRIPGMLNDASEYFDRSFELDTSKYDALAGKTFVLYQGDDWETALEEAEFLLNRQPTWRFLHEPSLDYNDVRLLTASANYKLGRYGTSLEIIIIYLNTFFEADSTSPAGHRAILEEIERLSVVYG